MVQSNLAGVAQLLLNLPTVDAKKVIHDEMKGE